MAGKGDNNDDNIFVYMGGDQEVPWDVTHIRVHESVKIITRMAFSNSKHLVSIEMHDGVEIIEKEAFEDCISLRRIKLPGVRVIEDDAFWYCTALEEVEFSDKLETIGEWAFRCTSLRSIKMPKVRIIGMDAFYDCKQLTEAVLSEDLERIVGRAFLHCPHLRRIAMPLKDNLLDKGVFDECWNLSQVNLVGGIHKTISSLLLDSWRNEMNDEIDSINRDLPNITSYQKTGAIQEWMENVLIGLEHYKVEHYVLLKELTTLLELALWKVKLDESQDERSVRSDQPAKKAKIDMKASRQEQRITSGASVVIKNVLPFLKLE
jgi:hypothetical protein